MKSLRIKQLIIRYLSALAVFMLAIFFTPNFDFKYYPYLLLFSLFVVLLDYVISVITEIHDIAYLRCVVGFVASAIIIYLAQFFVPGFFISIISTLIAALMYGTIQFFLPNKV